VRVSVAVAQGLAFGAGLPVVPVSSLEALALEAVEGGAQQVLACLDARMGEVYWGCFAASSPGMLSALGPPAVGPPATVRLPDRAPHTGAGHFRGIGRGFAAYPELCAIPGLRIEPEDRRALPQARAMARFGELRLAAGAGIDPGLLEPLYLRDKVAMTEVERGVARRVDK
jgi:tRNA threonylcarbamoyladenosine biosynthesis protein TsaB